MINHALLACGAAAGPVFLGGSLLEGVRRAGYRPFRHPVSSLALGGAGWVQTGTFFLAGSLSLTFAVGLWRATPSGRGALLIGIWAVGLLGAGAFRIDPVSGYPPGTPDRPLQPTLAGALHNLVSLIGFVALAAACFVFASPGSAGWAVYSMASAVLFATTMALSSVAFHQYRPLVDIGGLIQRISITVAWTWHTLLAVRMLYT